MRAWTGGIVAKDDALSWQARKDPATSLNEWSSVEPNSYQVQRQVAVYWMFSFAFEIHAHIAVT